MKQPIVIHEQNKGFVFALARNRLIVRIRAEKNRIDGCTLVYLNTGMYMADCENIEMKWYASDQMFDYFEGEIAKDDVISYLKYYFIIDTDKEIIYLNYNGFSLDVPKSGFYMYQYTNEGDVFDIPSWAQDAIVYQIFPERFCNGCKDNDPKGVEPWGTIPTRTNFMGGDLDGIIEKIGYLKELGVNTLYLNPIFSSISNHKYDTRDYLKIDESFGSKKELKQLVDRCHQVGIRVILDGVFNHCGYDFQPFLDVMKNGADSKYKDWFYIKRYPIKSAEDYECFGNYGGMPKLRLSNPDTREYILRVVRYWMQETDIDGWRLDVADEVEYTFLQELRRLVKKINPECLLLAETWYENTDILKGDQVDTLMNYLFRDAVVEYVAKSQITSEEFDARINKIIGVYPKHTVGSLYNLLGSHDTPRLLTVCGRDIRRMKASIALQFCFPGIPSVYYGDEIGMEGENDPDCRRCMEWDEERQNHDLLDFYRKMISLRNKVKTLRRGGLEINYCKHGDPVYGFVRSYGDYRVYVVINNADHDSNADISVAEDSGEMTDLLNGTKYPVKSKQFFLSKIGTGYNGCVSVSMAPYQVLILTKSED